jgi:hypothetical protein
MTDMKEVEWLARNQHHWQEGAVYICRREHDDNVLFETADNADYAQHGDTSYGQRYIHEQWLAERERIQKKPKWEDAPKNAEWLCQDMDGLWKFCDTKPDANHATRYWTADLIYPQNRGEALGDWRETLERRPSSTGSRDSDEALGKPLSVYATDASADTSAHVNASGSAFPKQQRYQDGSGEDWLDEFARTSTREEFRGAMRFTIGKYNRRMGKKDAELSEVTKMEDYCRRWREYLEKMEAAQ